MKKTLSVIMAGVLSLSMLFILTACNGNKTDTTTAAANGDTTTQAATETNGTTGQDTTGSTTAADTSTTAGNTDTSTTGKGNTDTTTKAGNSKPSTTAEIVAYYNAAANKVKVDKPGYTLVTTNIIGKITSSSGMIESLAKQVVPMFSTDPTTLTVPKGSNGDFPVKGQNYASKLVPSSLKSATCVDKVSTYEITLNFKDEKLATLAPDPTKTNHGQAMNVLSKGEVDAQTAKFAWIVKVQQFAPTYSGCYIKATVQKSTGNLLNATYYCVSDADIVAKPKLFGAIDAKVHFGVQEQYTLKY